MPQKKEQRPVANFLADLEYRSRYDYKFQQKVNTFVVTIIAIGIASYVTSQRKELAWVFVIVPIAAVLTWFSTGFFAELDIESSKAYCRRILPKKVSEKELMACVENRENMEDLHSSIATSVGNAWYWGSRY